ncbi:mechanosensitive ion channel family protein [Citreimonas salinaria]|uniref:Small-conductance mechanosensitive channel n=1 Tax=Citreimonas salinaria TaxID=321339 RepID=A0A1H3NZZ7_9RHOB|nr:mechanosensitive ion channel domain-containing protein [Citreimonas salinaria]SDY94462.1 Small-conductance mechanosensitive channel [Citreimonas salinaria]
MISDPRTWDIPLALGTPSPDLVASILLLFVLWVARMIVVKLIRLRSDLPPHVLRRWIATSRNVFLFLLLLGLVLIWAPQLRTFALSLAAVAVAIVVATKEMILCLSGSLMRASTRAFAVGDWIEVSGVRGEVVDHTLLGTTIQEFQPNSFHYTGRTTVVPNSVFFTAPIRNLTVVRDYTFHSFAITTEADIDLPSHEPQIASIVERHYGPLREEAERANARIERRSGVDILDPESRIRFSTTDLGKARVTVSLFCPTRLAETLEDAIMREVMVLFHAARKQEPAGDASP